MARIHLMALLLEVMLIDMTTISSLPITSKPIENTPEHLAWEAWIMVPPSHEKTRKITPKSIFILPNKTGGGGPSGGAFSQTIQCPPGHRVDNFKCIPTVSIDRNQILITQLQNLFHSTDTYKTDGDGNDTGSNQNYDYDYDYGETNYGPDTSEAYGKIGGSSTSDYNNEPFKINLSLGKLPSNQEQSKETASFDNMEDEDVVNYDMNIQPFLGKEKSPTTTSVSSTTSYISTTEEETVSESSTEKLNVTTPEPITTSSIVPSENTFSDSSSSSSILFETDESNYTTSAVPLLSSTESEMGIVDNITESDMLLGEETTSHTTIQNDNEYEMEIVTQGEILNEDIEEDLKNESFVHHTEQTEVNSETELANDPVEGDTTETSEEIQTTVLDPNYQGENETHESVLTESISTTTVIEDSPTIYDEQTHNISEVTESSSQTPELQSSTTTLATDIEILDHKLVQHDQEVESIKRVREQLKYSENIPMPADPYESNERFVYHHLDSSGSSENVHSTTPNYREQLRIINKIVEENKKRTSTESSIQTEEFEMPTLPQKDFVRLPNPEMFRQHPSIDSRVSFEQSINPEPVAWPSTIPPTVSSGSGSQRNTKPFWWLPSGWEIDKSGQKPLLLRFWSKVTENHDNKPKSDPTSMQSVPRTGYRENSRSPTENLYREISAQDVYKVLGTKNWKQNNR